MDFADLKDAVSGQTILIGPTGNIRIFIGFKSNGSVVTERSGGLCTWREEDIEHWTIKPKEQEPLKLYAYGIGSQCIEFRMYECDKDRLPEFDITYSQDGEE